MSEAFQTSRVPESHGFPGGVGLKQAGPPCDQTRNESQELLAAVTNARHALRDAQQVAGGTRTAFAQTTLVRPRSASRNRLVRTRMLGGVGRAVSNDRPYPIWAFFLSWFSSVTVR